MIKLIMKGWGEPTIPVFLKKLSDFKTVNVSTLLTTVYLSQMLKSSTNKLLDDKNVKKKTGQ